MSIPTILLLISIYFLGGSAERYICIKGAFIDLTFSQDTNIIVRWCDGVIRWNETCKTFNIMTDPVSIEYDDTYMIYDDTFCLGHEEKLPWSSESTYVFSCEFAHKRP